MDFNYTAHFEREESEVQISEQEVRQLSNRFGRQTNEENESNENEEGSRACLLKDNRYSMKPQINVILSVLTTSNQFFSFYLFTKSLNQGIILIPILLDIFLSASCIGLYYMYPLVFSVKLEQVKRVLLKETILLSIKCSTLYLVSMVVVQSSDKLVYGILILLFTASHVVLDYRRDYDSVYDSVFNLLGIVTINLTWIKLLVYKESMVWKDVLVFYNITAWLMMFGFAIDFLMHLVLILYELSWRKKKISVKVASVKLFLSFNFFFFSQVYFGFVNFVEDGPNLIMWINIQSFLLASILYFVAHGWIVVVFDKQLQKVVILTERYHFEERKGLNYILNMIRTAPTFFKTSPDFSRRASTAPQGENTHEDEEEEIECVVCCDNLANCVIHPCMHSACCRSCSINVIQANKGCLICRKAISKVLVTEKVNSNEYKVLEEIVMVSNGY